MQRSVGGGYREHGTKSQNNRSVALRTPAADRRFPTAAFPSAGARPAEHGKRLGAIGTGLVLLYDNDRANNPRRPKQRAMTAPEMRIGRWQALSGRTPRTLLRYNS